MVVNDAEPSGSNAADVADDVVERRRHQNRVSARRSRVKRKEQMSRVVQYVQDQAQSIENLEAKVRVLETILEVAKAQRANRDNLPSQHVENPSPANDESPKHGTAPEMLSEPGTAVVDSADLSSPSLSPQQTLPCGPDSAVESLQKTPLQGFGIPTHADVVGGNTVATPPVLASTMTRGDLSGREPPSPWASSVLGGLHMEATRHMQSPQTSTPQDGLSSPALCSSVFPGFASPRGLAVQPHRTQEASPAIAPFAAELTRLGDESDLFTGENCGSVAGEFVSGQTESRVHDHGNGSILDALPMSGGAPSLSDMDIVFTVASDGAATAPAMPAPSSAPGLSAEPVFGNSVTLAQEATVLADDTHMDGDGDEPLCDKVLSAMTMMTPCDTRPREELMASSAAQLGEAGATGLVENPIHPSAPLIEDVAFTFEDSIEYGGF